MLAESMKSRWHLAKGDRVLLMSHIFYCQIRPTALLFHQEDCPSINHILALFLCVSRSLFNLVLMLAINSFRCFLSIYFFKHQRWRTIWLCTLSSRKNLFFSLSTFRSKSIATSGLPLHQVDAFFQIIWTMKHNYWKQRVQFCLSVHKITCTGHRSGWVNRLSSISISMHLSTSSKHQVSTSSHTSWKDSAHSWKETDWRSYLVHKHRLRLWSRLSLLPSFNQRTSIQKFWASGKCFSAYNFKRQHKLLKAKRLAFFPISQHRLLLFPRQLLYP